VLIATINAPTPRERSRSRSRMRCASRSSPGGGTFCAGRPATSFARSQTAAQAAGGLGGSVLIAPRKPLNAAVGGWVLAAALTLAWPAT